MIPGSRGTPSYLVRALASEGEKAAWSLAHGAGRRWQRGYAKSRLSHKYRVEDLQRTELGGRVICEDRELLYDEAPQAYKDIAQVIADLEAAGLIATIAVYRPVLTYKVRRARDEVKATERIWIQVTVGTRPGRVPTRRVQARRCAGEGGGEGRASSATCWRSLRAVSVAQRCRRCCRWKARARAPSPPKTGAACSGSAHRRCVPVTSARTGSSASKCSRPPDIGDDRARIVGCRVRGDARVRPRRPARQQDGERGAGNPSPDRLCRDRARGALSGDEQEARARPFGRTAGGGRGRRRRPMPTATAGLTTTPSNAASPFALSKARPSRSGDEKSSPRENGERRKRYA